MGTALNRRLLQTKPFAGPEEEAVLNLLIAAAWISDRLERALAPCGITHVQYNVLRILRGVHPGGHPRCEIARRMIDRAPDVTRLIDRLVKAGLAERFRGPEDRREAVTRITAKGLAALKKADATVERAMASTGKLLAGARGRAVSETCESIYAGDIPE